METASSSELILSQVRVNGVTGRCHSEPGSWEPTRATQMIIWADDAAPKPSTDARPPLTNEAPAAANPRTVAGPTKGPASAFATKPDMLTRPETAAITGVVAS
jgi:hypothetical protein